MWIKTINRHKNSRFSHNSCCNKLYKIDNKFIFIDLLNSAGYFTQYRVIAGKVSSCSKVMKKWHFLIQSESQLLFPLTCRYSITAGHRHHCNITFIKNFFCALVHLLGVCARHPRRHQHGCRALLSSAALGMLRGICFFSKITNIIHVFLEWCHSGQVADVRVSKRRRDSSLCCLKIYKGYFL